MSSLPANRPQQSLQPSAPSALTPTTPEQLMSAAEFIVKSGLAPTGIDTPQKAMLVLWTGHELGLTPMRSLRELYVVRGQVGMTTKLMCSLLRRAGGDYEINESTDKQATVTIRRHDGATYRTTITIEQAQAAKWHLRYNGDKKEWQEKETWKSQPDLMLTYRALCKGIRIFDPGCIMGLATTDELDDGAINGAWRDADWPTPEAQPEPEPTLGLQDRLV